MNDRLAAVAADLRRRGATVHTAETGDAVDRGVLARDLADAGGPLGGLDAPAWALPLRDGRPLSVVSELATAAHAGRVPLLVADDHTLATARELLATPFLLAGEDDDGREFVAVEDRIALPDGTFAAVGGHGPLTWRTAGYGDTPGLELAVGDRVAAALPGVDALTCPGPAADAFPYRYARADGRYRVHDYDGVVGAYPHTRAMRTDGYRPVPLPLVPGHHVRENAALARAVRLVAVDDGAVRYGRPD